MFSGIVEEAAPIVGLKEDLGNLHVTMQCSFVDELKIDQSIAHNGVCLTVVDKTKDISILIKYVPNTFNKMMAIDSIMYTYQFSHVWCGCSFPFFILTYFEIWLLLLITNPSTLRPTLSVYVSYNSFSIGTVIGQTSSYTMGTTPIKSGIF